MADLKISDLPTDIVTLADGDKFPAAKASDLTADVFATALEIKGYVLADTIIRRAPTGGYALANVSTQQALFPTPSGTTLATGVYIFELFFNISGMSATSGNLGFSIIGAGTATLSNLIIGTLGVDGTGSVATQSGNWVQATSTGAAIVTAATASKVFAQIKGTFEVTTSGTIIPSITLATASEATLSDGSFLTISKIGATGLTSKGSWA